MSKDNPARTIQVYNENAEAFNEQYLSTKTEKVHECWLEEYLPASGVLLDVGAGVGRDACYFAEQGLDVVAMEPAEELVKIGKRNTQNLSVKWVIDALPELSKIEALELKFDVILLSAVWMHIPPSSRSRAFRKLSNLLKPKGVFIISLRHGPSPDERDMYSVSVDELSKLTSQYGLSLKKHCQSDDTLSRREVHWETVVMQLPDDGSGAFPTIRNILMNDAKSSTYKLALVRSLLRIADGHPGAVMSRDAKTVTIPLGLVALYWARQFKPLLDKKVQQSSNPNLGLGFVKPDGWNALGDIVTGDLTIGHLFQDEQAQAIHKTLKHISATIRDMPVKYIKLPNSEKQVFEAEVKRTSNSVNQLFIDQQTLESYGTFSIPRNIWELMVQYACWIEPVVLNEWVAVMKDYKHNAGIESHALAQYLAWHEAERTTKEARKRVEMLQSTSTINCVWSHKRLKRDYEVDHCLPFARWPNNDLWNLLPTNRNMNNQKRDKIPHSKRFDGSKDDIVEWWRLAWSNEFEQRFFTEASLSLPGLNQPSNQPNIEDVFEALKLQSIRVSEMQQIPRW